VAAADRLEELVDLVVGLGGDLEVLERTDLGLDQVVAVHGGGDGGLVESGGHELQQRHLGGGVLHGDPVRVEVGVAAAALHLLALAVPEVVDQDLLGEREGPAEALTTDADGVGQPVVDGLDELDGGGRSDRHDATLIQVREIRYVTIADDLRRQITAGDLVAGAVLPSEADLAGSYGVSRVTVRKALEVLRDEGLIGSRQGFGWFVAAPMVRRSLGALSTIEADLAAQGREPMRKVLSFRFLEPEVAGERGGDLEVVRVNLADGQPFALVTVWCPAELGRSLSRDDVERSTF